MQKNWREEFQNPSAAFRGKPFWAWNGDLRKDELLRQIDVMKEMGFGGYFMHSRVGLETEYLGEEWFSLINCCTDYGARQGMENWLYDEDRWPSGTAGGMVTTNPNYRMQFLEMKVEETYTCSGEEVIAFACILRAEGYEKERILHRGERLNAGESAVIFHVVPIDTSNFYNGYTYVDTMNKKATEDFLRRTHEKYRQNCGERVGGTIRGIFTDEPHRGPLFSTFSMGSVTKAPYTKQLFEEFEKQFGYSLKERLLELFLAREIRPVKWHYTNLIQQLFLENFAAPISKWCRDNHMIFTGHVLQEDSLANQVAMQGSMMRFYESMDYPGIDILSEGNRKYWVAKQLNSVVRQMGKTAALSELYGCTGWQLNFESHKHVGDWQALFGVNLRCPHLSWYTMAGEAKRDYPASILHQSAWYKEYHYVEDYFSRLHVLLQTGEPECELLVINPIESVSARVYSGCFRGLEAVDERMQELERIYTSVFHLLAGARIDFDYGDEEIMSRKATVKAGRLLLGNMQYKKVLLAGMDTIRRSTLQRLKEFVEAGGEVYIAGAAPTYVDAVKCEEINEIGAKYITLEEIPQAMGSGQEITIEPENKAIFAQTRRLPEGRLVVLLHTEREKDAGLVKIGLGQGRCVKRFNARTGTEEAVVFQRENGLLYVEETMYAGEEKIYLVSEEMENEVPPQKWATGSVALPQQFDYDLDEPNICVLDYVQYRIEGGEWSEPMEILQADRQIRDHFRVPYRGGEMLQPWFVKKKQGGKTDKLGKIALRYAFWIEEIPQTPVEVVLEHPQDFTMWMGDNQVKLEQSTGKWIDICFDRFALPTELLKRGKNEITLETEFFQTNDLEAIYLLGDFGVRLEKKGAVLCSLPQQLHIGDVTDQGLPFYSGRLQYRTQLPEVGGQNVRVWLNNPTGACTLVNGKMIAFSPYYTDVMLEENGRIEIEIVLTRRNTFGPLHALPKIAPAYGPQNFVTTGLAYSQDYQLLEQGLLEAPKVEILR